MVTPPDVYGELLQDVTLHTRNPAGFWFRCILEDAPDAQHINGEARKAVLNSPSSILARHGYWHRYDVFCLGSPKVELPKSTYLRRAVRMKPSHQRELSVSSSDVVARPFFL